MLKMIDADGRNPLLESNQRWCGYHTNVDVGVTLTLMRVSLNRRERKGLILKVFLMVVPQTYLQHHQSKTFYIPNPG